MAACQQVSKWITQNVLVPVAQFITQAQQVCQQVQQQIEQQVNTPVNEAISQAENQCSNWPWPLDWVCSVVMVVVNVVVWVVETVLVWVWTLVCQIVTVVIGIVVTLVLQVIGWFVTFLVCIFTDPLQALKSLGDLWYIILNTIGSVFDFVTLLLGDIEGILTSVENLIDTLAATLGWLGVILGLLKGIIQLLRDLVNIISDIVDSVKSIVLGILGLNLCRIVSGFANLGVSLVRTLADTGLGVLSPVRAGGYLVAGVRDSVKAHQLQDIITAAVNGAFASDSGRIARSLKKIGLGVYPMGLPFTVDARRLFLSSESDTIDLRALNKSGVINLHALAGQLSSCGKLLNEPEGEVVYAGTNLPVSYSDIETFLSSGPGSVPEFQVFAITQAKFLDQLQAAQRKAQTIGVLLNFPRTGVVEAVSTQEVPLNAGVDNPPGDGVQQGIFKRIGRTGVNDDLSIIPVVNHFHYVLDSAGNELFGLTSEFRPSCGSSGVASGVTYRLRPPDWVFRWVPIHEMGHYLGLNHHVNPGLDYCNDSPTARNLEEIMFAPVLGINIAASTVFEYLLLGGEPLFTADDAKTVWKWITTDGASLLP